MIRICFPFSCRSVLVPQWRPLSWVQWCAAESLQQWQHLAPLWFSESHWHRHKPTQKSTYASDLIYNFPFLVELLASFNNTITMKNTIAAWKTLNVHWKCFTGYSIWPHVHTQTQQICLVHLWAKQWTDKSELFQSAVYFQFNLHILNVCVVGLMVCCTNKWL